MRILLDTHVWLWSLAQPEKLGKRAGQLLADANTKVYLSAVSSWEAAIKWRLGKLALPGRPEDLVADSLATNGYLKLDISHDHSCRVSQLADHHTDPFDRLLIAQAHYENLTVLTADKLFLAYPCAVMWALE